MNPTLDADGWPKRPPHECDECKPPPAPLHAECNHGKAQPTPTPWHVAGYGVLGPKAVLSDQICVTMTNRPTDEREANAAYIVRAVNLHQELIGALRKCRYELGKDHPQYFLEAIDALLAKAEEK